MAWKVLNSQNMSWILDLSQLNTNLTFFKIDATISALFSTIITGLKPKLLSAAHHNCILLALSWKSIYVNPVLVK